MSVVIDWHWSVACEPVRILVSLGTLIYVSALVCIPVDIVKGSVGAEAAYTVSVEGIEGSTGPEGDG